MNRSTQKTILAFSGLTLVFAVVSAAFNWRLALGFAAVAGSCAVWAAMMSTASGVRDDSQNLQSSLSSESSVEPGAPDTHPVDLVGSEAEPVASSSPPSELPEPTPPAEPIEPALAPPLAEPFDIPLTVEPCAVVGALLGNAARAGAPVSAHLWLEDVGTPTLRLVCAEGELQPDSTPVPTSEGVLGRSLSDDAVRCEALSESADATLPLLWRCAIPLTTDEASGVAAVDFAAEPDHELMTQVTSAMRGLLTGSLALHVARSEASSARQLLDTASELSRLLDPDAVVATALDHALTLSGAETGSVMLLEPDGVKMRIVCASGLPQDVVGDTRVSEGEGIAGWVLASGRPLVVEDLENKGPQSRRHGVLSAVSVPILDDDGVLGVLNVGSRRFHPRFSRSHVRALEAIGRIAAISLRNARAMTVTQDLFFDTLKALALAMETRDPYTRGGTARILEITTSLGDSMGLDAAAAHALKLAALLHDIGMSAAGDGVAASDRPLTTVEWGMLKMHPQIAAEILTQAPALQTVIPIVFHHHEHFDGRGYAHGLAGHEIPLGARILSVADAYVAMTSARPYRAAMTAEQAVAELVENSGTQFDPDVVAALMSLMASDTNRFAMRS
jgi:HD-GYP domain-containing protein (c-di-GMP phosphodiesterase class II)